MIALLWMFPLGGDRAGWFGFINPELDSPRIAASLQVMLLTGIVLAVALPRRSAGSPFGAVGIAQRDVEPAVEGEEELARVMVDVPEVLTPGVRDAYVVVVDAGHDLALPTASTSSRSAMRSPGRAGTSGRARSPASNPGS